jgi:hypothetical protein
MTDLEYNEPLDAKVVRLYIMKGYTMGMFDKFGPVKAEEASKIINKHNLMRKPQSCRPGKWTT